MKILFSIITFFALSFVLQAQEVPSQKKLENSDNAKIVMYLKVASVKYDSLVQYQSLIRYAEGRCIELKGELVSIFSQAEIEMLKTLGRYGFNPDLYTIMVQTDDDGEIQLHVVKKSDLPDQQDGRPSIDDSKIIK